MSADFGVSINMIGPDIKRHKAEGSYTCERKISCHFTFSDYRGFIYNIFSKYPKKSSLIVPEMYTVPLPK